MEFNTSLLREKFVINAPEAKAGGTQMVALSNRMVIDLVSSNKKYKERFIVRAQNMHACTRMSARIIQSFNQSGPMMNRNTPFDWEAAWDSLINDYEHAFNPQRWIAIYHKGRVVFESGERNPFLDVIEQCDAHSSEDLYDNSVALAEDAFKQTGKTVTIEHDSNVALVISFEDNQGRVGIILRGPDRTTTFNFSASGSKEKALSIQQCMGVAAAFLEGIQLAFMVGMNNVKRIMGIIERFSREEKQTKEAIKRLRRLGTEIANLEAAFDVHYRPEKPEFKLIVSDAEKLAEKILEPPPKNPKKEDTEDEKP